MISDEIAKSEIVVQMGPLLDGVAPHMSEYPEARSFRVADEEPVDVAEDGGLPRTLAQRRQELGEPPVGSGHGDRP